MQGDQEFIIYTLSDPSLSLVADLWWLIRRLCKRRKSSKVCVEMDRSTLVSCLKEIEAENRSAIKLIRISCLSANIFEIDVVGAHEYRDRTVRAEDFIKSAPESSQLLAKKRRLEHETETHNFVAEVEGDLDPWGQNAPEDPLEQ